MRQVAPVRRPEQAGDIISAQLRDPKFASNVIQFRQV